MITETDHGLVDETVDEYACNSCGCTFSIGWISVIDEAHPDPGFTNIRHTDGPKFCPNCGKG